MFVRAGTTVPLDPPSAEKLQEMDNSRRLLRAYRGGKTTTRVYIDAGDSEGYRTGEYAFTSVVSQRDGRRAMVTVQPREGHYAGQPAATQIAVEFPVAGYPETVTVNGTSYARSDDGREGGWSYDGATLITRVVVPLRAGNRPLVVDATFAATPGIDGLLHRMKRVRTAVEWLKAHWTPPSQLADDLSRAAQLDLLIAYRPEQLATLVAQFDARLRTLAKQVNEVDEFRATPEVKAQIARLMDATQR